MVDWEDLNAVEFKCIILNGEFHLKSTWDIVLPLTLTVLFVFQSIRAAGTVDGDFLSALSDGDVRLRITELRRNEECVGGDGQRSDR